MGAYTGPWPFLGCILILVSLILFLFTHRQVTTHNKIDFVKGVELKRDNLTILIKSGEIQTIKDITRNSVVVLPANTTFVDDCAADKRTAMGAFFMEQFPEEIGELPALFEKILVSRGIERITNGHYAAGTTIILPEKLAKPAKIVVTASTIRSSESGILSNPQIICTCVEEILKVTADQRVDTIYLPILGSGHGGIDRGMALLFLCLALLHFSKIYHHIYKVQIVVHPKDIEKLKQSKEFRQIQAL